MATSFSGGRSRSTRREPATMGKQLVNFIPEAAPRQHILRASFQTKVWHASCLVKPPLPPPMENGWRTVKDSLHPVYFEGNMSAEFFRDLVCSCKGKSQCKKSCVCSEQNLLHVLTYVLPKDHNHVKTYIHISLQKTFNVLTT